MDNFKRKRVQLTSSLEKRWGAYALAGVAGLGAALPQSAEAAIVYTKVQAVVGPNASVGIDLNGDGTNDFLLENTFFHSSDSTVALLTIDALDGDEVAINNSMYANALGFRAVIGTNLEFTRNVSVRMAGHVTSTQGGDLDANVGPFVNVTNKFVALKLSLAGKTYYGWARVDTKVGNAVECFLVDYAYETIPGKSIQAGEGIKTGSVMGSLGMLAYGAGGLNTVGGPAGSR